MCRKEERRNNRKEKKWITELLFYVTFITHVGIFVFWWLHFKTAVFQSLKSYCCASFPVLSFSPSNAILIPHSLLALHFNASSLSPFSSPSLCISRALLLQLCFDRSDAAHWKAAGLLEKSNYVSYSADAVWGCSTTAPLNIGQQYLKSCACDDVPPVKLS